MGDVTVRLPAASPELYLQAVEWWRAALTYAYSAAIRGQTTERVRGTDPIRDELIFDGPARMEGLARQGMEDGLTEIQPEVTYDSEFLTGVVERGASMFESVTNMLRYGGPQLEPEVASLRARSREITVRALAEISG